MLAESFSPHPLAEQAQACGRLTQADGPAQVRQVLQCGHFSSYARCKSSGNCSPTTQQFRSRRGHGSILGLLALSGQPSSHNKTPFPRPQHEGKLHSSRVVSASSEANSVARHTGTIRCITTGPRLPLNRRACTCRTFTVL